MDISREIGKCEEKLVPRNYCRKRKPYLLPAKCDGNAISLWIDLINKNAKNFKFQKLESMFEPLNALASLISIQHIKMCT